MNDRRFATREEGDRIPETPIFDRARANYGYELNKMAMSLTSAVNREAFKQDEAGYIARFGLTDEQKDAVMRRDWHEMIRLGGNLFFILKISAVDPVPITAIGAAQAGMEHNEFLRKRLGKNV